MCPLTDDTAPTGRLTSVEGHGAARRGDRPVYDRQLPRFEEAWKPLGRCAADFRIRLDRDDPETLAKIKIAVVAVVHPDVVDELGQRESPAIFR